MENKKFRNPFPAVGKVFKYEMMSSARVILPIYGILLLMSLIVGVFVIGENMNFDTDTSSFGTLKVIFCVLTGIMFFATFVIVLCIIERRYKKSLLSDEAYLNLTLPVSVGQHLWGRYLVDFVWCISYGFICFLALMLIVIRGWGEMSSVFVEILKGMDKFQLEYGYSVVTACALGVINIVSVFMLICTFIYMSESVVQMIGKHKTLISIGLFIVVFIVYFKASQFIGSTHNYDDFALELRKFLWLNLAYNFVWCAVNSVITRLVLTFKLNLA